MLERRVRNRLRIFGVRGAALSVAAMFWARAFEAGLVTCALTGLLLDLDSAQADHDNPRCQGGSGGLANLQWVRADANRLKSGRTTAEFGEHCKWLMG